MNPIKEIHRYFAFIEDLWGVNHHTGWVVLWLCSGITLFVAVALSLIFFTKLALIVLAVSLVRYLWDYRSVFVEFWNGYRNFEI